jgi:primosomal protein N' (replication factor Y)
MANLKLVIVDEEHDKSYKQTTTSFRYNARDIAIKLAHLHNIPVILGSATPSLISLNNGYSKKYTSHILNARASGVDLPKINFLNTQQLPKGVFLHSLAIENIQKELDKNNKVLLFLNRRGFAPLLQCSQCGWRAKCNKCDSFMVFHKSINKAICHVCNLMKNAPAKCPECKEDKIFQIGIGTQKLEELVKKIFTKTKVVRFDQDSANTSNKMQTEMKKLDNDDPCLIIGTQMLAKGHNIKNLQLVVVVHPDSAFFSGDVFALEDMVQTITQVVGRSGRGNKQGSVIVQTAMPKEFLWKCIAHHDYEGATKYLLKQRKDASLPPFSKMVIFIANAKQSQTAENTLNDLQKNLINIEGAMSFGVMPTTIDKKNNQYYRQLILTGSFSVIQEVKRRGLVYINKSKENIVLDIDPISFSG